MSGSYEYRNLENDDNLLEYEIMLQHDGAPPNFIVQVRQFLNECFSMRWIGKSGNRRIEDVSIDVSHDLRGEIIGKIWG